MSPVLRTPSVGEAPVAELAMGSNGPVVRLRGAWRLSLLPRPSAGLLRRLGEYAREGHAWDLDHVTVLDTATAVLLWRAWERRLPDGVRRRPDLLPVFERIQSSAPAEPVRRPSKWLDGLAALGRKLRLMSDHILAAFALAGQLLLDVLWLVRHPRAFPFRETSANIYKAGVRAMPVAALVGFLIGVALAYLSAVQLRNYGAESFIVNLLGMAVVRELGPTLVAVLVAGRSGSAMTAQIGTMRVTEEIDALMAMGISPTVRLVVPKVLALALAMPMLVVWTSAAALFGGMLAAQVYLDIGSGFFLETLPRVVPISNLWIALAKGWIFGWLIGLTASHFGLQVRPTTESLATNTTYSVVTSITLVIVADAAFAILTREIGMPL